MFQCVAEEILKRRYARGEISREEYVQASETLHIITTQRAEIAEVQGYLAK